MLPHNTGSCLTAYTPFLGNCGLFCILTQSPAPNTKEKSFTCNVLSTNKNPFPSSGNKDVANKELDWGPVKGRSCEHALRFPLLVINCFHNYWKRCFMKFINFIREHVVWFDFYLLNWTINIPNAGSNIKWNQLKIVYFASRANHTTIILVNRHMS